MASTTQQAIITKMLKAFEAYNLSTSEIGVQVTMEPDGKSKVYDTDASVVIGSKSEGADAKVKAFIKDFEKHCKPAAGSDLGAYRAATAFNADSNQVLSGLDSMIAGKVLGIKVPPR